MIGLIGFIALMSVAMGISNKGARDGYYTLDQRRDREMLAVVAGIVVFAFAWLLVVG